MANVETSHGHARIKQLNHIRYFSGSRSDGAADLGLVLCEIELLENLLFAIFAAEVFFTVLILDFSIVKIPRCISC